VGRRGDTLVDEGGEEKGDGVAGMGMYNPASDKIVGREEVRVDVRRTLYSGPIEGQRRGESESGKTLGLSVVADDPKATERSRAREQTMTEVRGGRCLQQYDNAGV